MWLDCGEHGLMHLSRITPKSVVAKERREIPPCFANLVVVVDGQRVQHRVHVPKGFTNGRMLTPVNPYEEPPF